ncbi:hypothetical protein GE09DRAFT_313249 [Coniochaeta sp. 2T2.1]|nr:hypothetical protein GE09DRAFT_313249 [Coniochaeta sp. 2T2.1]
MPSHTHPLERHSSLPLPSSPPSVSRSSIWEFEPSPSPESSATLRISPDTPASSRYLMTPAIPSSCLPPPYSSGGKSSAKTPSKSFAASKIKQTSSSAAETPKTPHTSVKTSKLSSSVAKPLKTPYTAAAVSKASFSAARVPKTPFSDRNAPKTASAPAKVTWQSSPPSAQLSSSGHVYEQLRAGPSLQLGGEHQHFSLLHNQLVWKKLSRTSATKICRILDPKDPAAERKYKSIYSRDWLLAQCFLYDLFKEANQYGLESNSTEKVLREMVLEAARAGKCDSMPARILAIEARLQRVAAEKLTSRLTQTVTPKVTVVVENSSDNDSDSDKEVNNRDSQIDSNEDDEADEVSAEEPSEDDFHGELPDPWAELHATPGAQANLDPDRFFNYYFLTNGNADRKKTPQGLRLDGLAKDSISFLQRAGRYGLYRWWTKTEPLRVCIGWDLRKVQAMADYTDHKVNSRRLEKRTSEETRLRKIHCDLVAQCEKEKIKGGTTPWNPSGQYMITADQLLDHCSPDGPFTWNISSKTVHSRVGHGWRGGFDLGVAQGSMILSTCSAVMDWLIADADKACLREGDASDSSRKRKAEPTPTQLHPRKKGDSQGPPRKLPRYYEVRFRGREHFDGRSKIFKPRSGHIYFNDETFTTFKGTFNMGEHFGVVGIHGAKFSIDAPEESLVPKWNDSFESAVAVDAIDQDEEEEDEATPRKVKKTKKSKRASFADEFTTPQKKGKSSRSSSKKKRD